ncbi:MAG TPA: hypothetical protein VK616_06370, partial [Flavitalea sp.]|nr:hypothetical protein [Flavitalea sp.]
MRKSKKIKDRCRNALYAIVARMYSSQEMSTPSASFDDEDITLLESEGLVVRKSSKTIQLFHQTFFDYAFARQFVETGKDIFSYLKENNQSLFIRSCLKIILTHFREYNFETYIKVITRLLQDNTIRFHIKELLVNFLGFIEEPYEKERVFVLSKIIGAPFELPFFDSVLTRSWVVFLLDSGVVSNFRRSKDLQKENAASQLLFRNADSATAEIIFYLSELPKNKQNEDLISNFLYFLQRWTPQVFPLFDRVKAGFIDNPFLHSHMLERALTGDQSWVYNEFRTYLLARVRKLKKGSHAIYFDHSEEELLKKLFSINGEKAYELSIDIISALINKTRFNFSDGTPLFLDFAYLLYQRRDSLHDQEELMEIFISQVEKFASEEHLIFNRFHKKYKHTKSTTLLRVLLYGYLSKPDSYATKALETIQFIKAEKGFDHDDKLQHLLRQVIHAVFPFLTGVLRRKLIDLILSVSRKDESGAYIHPITNKRVIIKATGQTKYLYLSAIPQAELFGYADAKKIYQELHRKFGAAVDKEPHIVALFGVHAPYNDSNYLNMALDDWENTFKKINKGYEKDFDSGKGGLIE